MIQFRCWYCGKRYAIAEVRIGEELNCSCKHRLRVPKKSGGRCRVRTITDWLVEILVYGGGGAIIGCGLGIFILSRGLWIPRGKIGLLIVSGFTLAGLFAGVFGGEPGLNWIGRKLRDWENS